MSGAPSPSLPRACLPPPSPSGRGRHLPSHQKSNSGDSFSRSAGAAEMLAWQWFEACGRVAKPLSGGGTVRKRN